ncbi:hypothetical protein [Longimicrobium sp.]|uniref:hypothetical protein n=1 Tax=Longimicrobium sp. TaxID=2029185 RepID=UPI002E2F7D1A|nr:hypothetical protein [Longimicrobium sp.]HEX6038261.1 hypothetical protein [Longimicrobium sp.]
MNDSRDGAPWAAEPPDGGVDPERLAALLDGRLDEAERDDLLARLADDDDDLALFAEAAGIQRALEEEDATVIAAASVPPHTAPLGLAPAPIPVADVAHDEPLSGPGVIPIRRPARRVDRRLALLAAVLAGVTLLPLGWRALRPGAISAPSQAVAMLESRDASSVAGWTPAWGSTRGGGDPLVERSTSARVGALAVVLELAIRAGDVEQRQYMVSTIQKTLENTLAPAGNAFEPLEDGTRTDRDQLLSDLEYATQTATGFLEADYVALGGWAEAARFAAARRDAAFFRSARTARTLDRASSFLGDDEQAKAAVERIRAARETDPLGWPALTQAVDDLVDAIAR